MEASFQYNLHNLQISFHVIHGISQDIYLPNVIFRTSVTCKSIASENSIHYNILNYTLFCKSLVLKSLLNSVGSVGAWVAWVHKILAWVAWVQILAWVAWVHKILAWVKKGVSGVGRSFGVGGVGLRCFVKKVLLKVS